jgi:hypothetical protein
MDIFMDYRYLSEEDMINVSLAQLLTSKNDSSVIECFNLAELGKSVFHAQPLSSFSCITFRESPLGAEHSFH